MKKISIVTACFNEEHNVEPLINQVREVFRTQLSGYDYDHLFIDNHSTDSTVARLKAVAALDPRIKIIVNARNFGHIRSPYHAIIQPDGDAVICMVADLQDPPDMLPALIQKWESGFKIVCAVKEKSKESAWIFILRKLYYALMKRFSDDGAHISNFTGFGLYDKAIIQILRNLEDPYPYFRGIISEIGYSRAEIPYTQEKRLHGKTKNNFYTLYDMGMLGLINHSKLPLRLMSFTGIIIAVLSVLASIVYLAYKLLFWQNFQVGLAPLVCGVFFLMGIQFIFLGIMGEYIGVIYTQVKHRPRVFEEERVNC